jgi:hypothetical protein
MSDALDMRGVQWTGPRDNGYGDKVARVHRALAVLYALLALGIFAAMWSDATAGAPWLALIIGLPAILHGAIAVGAFKRQGWSRVASILVGVLMLAGFPIGTILGIYLIRYASPGWQE